VPLSQPVLPDIVRYRPEGLPWSTSLNQLPPAGGSIPSHAVPKILLLITHNVMKKDATLFLFLFFILFACHAMAQTISMSTYYPAPVANYNTIKLATNAPVPTCNLTNIGTMYTDSTGTLYVCMTSQTSGTAVFVVYPQQCYNSFCSCQCSGTGCTCSTCPAGQPLASNAICQAGFNVLTSVSGNTCKNGAGVSTAGCSAFQTDSNTNGITGVVTNTFTLSWVCCTPN